MAQPSSQPPSGTRDPVIIQLDQKCLYSTLKEFFSPLRTNDPRTDFFAIYGNESSEFDVSYAKKYDEDLNTTLIFAGLFSAVSATFAAAVQPQLEQDSGNVTVVYLQILIHTMNNTLFPDVDPSSTAWTGPPRGIVVVQSLLYATLAISLFAAFLAMLGKQWINRYLRNRGGSAADKSRDRQRKLDGHTKWHFFIVIECLPVMLQFALLLFGCALSVYLWTINRAVAWVVLAFTLAGATAYVLFTLAAVPYYSCPYQTPLSTLIETLVKYLKHDKSTFACSVRHHLASLAGIYSQSMKMLLEVLKRLRSGVRSALRNLGRIPDHPRGVEEMPLSAVGRPWFLDQNDVCPDNCKADARCISWILNYTTDNDVILYAARFAADTIWYPEMADTLSPHLLFNLFRDCLSYGRLLPGKQEHAVAIGMALASVVSIQLCLEPERADFRELRESIYAYVWNIGGFEPTFATIIGILRISAVIPHRQFIYGRHVYFRVPEALSPTYKLCLSRAMLQTIWRWRRVPDAPAVFDLEEIDLLCKSLMANGDDSNTGLKINCILIMAIALGCRVGDLHGLFVPSNVRVLRSAVNFLHGPLVASIRGENADRGTLNLVLSALFHLDPIQDREVMGTAFSWITAILNSRYPEDEQYRMASHVVRLFGRHLDSGDPNSIFTEYSHYVTPLVRFLSLCEKFPTMDSTPHVGLIALRILLTTPWNWFDATILPILMWTLPPTNPLQSRGVALKIFNLIGSELFSPWLETTSDKFTKSVVETISDKGIERLMEAVGDPFQPATDSQDGDSVGTAMKAAAILIQSASSNRWNKHLRRSNLTSCEEIASNEDSEDRRALLKMLKESAFWLNPDRTLGNIPTAIGRLRELQCPNIAELVITWAMAAGAGSSTDLQIWRSMGV